MTIDLRKLAEPFPAGDIEWRVSRSGMNKNGTVFCMVLAYITARAIANRLDAVVGPENWQNTPLVVHELRPGVMAMQVGISIRVGEDWITRYDVSEPTHVEPAKGGFSGAMKRAGRFLELADISTGWMRRLQKHPRTEVKDGSTLAYQRSRAADRTIGNRHNFQHGLCQSNRIQTSL